MSPRSTAVQPNLPLPPSRWLATPRGHFAALEFPAQLAANGGDTAAMAAMAATVATVATVPTVPTVPTVLLLHGFPDFPGNFAPLAQALAGHGLHVVVPWLRGYAPSPTTGSFQLEDLAADVVALATSCAATGAIHVVGHDWGAMLAYAACALAPTHFATATTLAMPHPLAFLRALRGWQAVRSWYMAALQLPGSSAWSKARNFAFVDQLWRTWSPDFSLDDRHRHALHTCLATSWPAPLAYYRNLLRPLPAALRRLRGPLAMPLHVPMLQLHGRNDGCIAPLPLVLARDQRRYFAAGLQHQIFDGVGHFFPHEKPRQCADRIAAFIRAAG